MLKKIVVKQYKNASNIISWFSNIENKKSSAFIQFDIKEFYPSIKEELSELSVGSKKVPEPSPEIKTVNRWVCTCLFEHFKKLSFVPSWESSNFHVPQCCIIIK